MLLNRNVLTIDAKGVRRITKGAFWFKKSPDGTEWLVGCGGPSCYGGKTLEEALAKLVVGLADVAHFEGAWNVGHHKTPELW